ncbi:hypothetical protein EAF04_002558 [Stromatinia cepivora]|nr:hypothetical protein EAF04_002558 [Stromatinia cepivora]
MISMGMSTATPNSWAGASNKPLGFLERHLSSFRPFTRLPIEVRLMIWEEACLQGRIVTVFPSERILEAQHSQSHGDLQFYVFKSRDPIPGILHANQESRRAARKFYKCAFDTRAEFPLITTTGTETAGSIWINPTCDIICPMSFMTDSQCDVLRTKMYDLKIERISLNDCAFQRFASMPCDKWGVFLTRSPPEWMNEHIKEVTLYTSRHLLLPDDDIELTEINHAIAYPPAIMKSKLELMRRHHKFFKDLQRLQKLQLDEDEKNERLGRESTRINDCPQWLYDCRSTWCKPRQREMASHLVHSILNLP